MQHPRPYLIRIVITFGEELIRFFFRRHRQNHPGGDDA